MILSIATTRVCYVVIISSNLYQAPLLWPFLLYCKFYKELCNNDLSIYSQSGQGGTPGPSQTYSQYPASRTNYPPTSRYNAFGGLPPYGSYPMGFQQQPSFADPHMPPMHPAAQMASGSMIPPRIPTPPMQSLSRSITPSPETVTPIGLPKQSDLKTQETQTKVTSQAGTQTSQHKKKSANKPLSRKNSVEDGAQVSQGSSKANTRDAGDKEANRRQAPVESDQRPREGNVFQLRYYEALSAINKRIMCCLF